MDLKSFPKWHETSQRYKSLGIDEAKENIPSQSNHPDIRSTNAKKKGEEQGGNNNSVILNSE